MAFSSKSPSRKGRQDERQPLLGQSSQSAQDYHSIPDSEALPPAHTSNSSPYLTVTLRLYFFLGILLLFMVTVLLILLGMNVFQPIPLLLPPHRSPAVLPFWFAVISASILAPGLLFFELASKATNIFHLFVLFCSAVDVILLGAVPEFRTTHSYLGFLSVGITLCSALWAFTSSMHLQKQYVHFTVNPDVGAPVVAQVPLSRTQAKWTRRFKLIWAIVGGILVAAASLLITFDLTLDAADSAFKPLGNLTLVHPRALTKDPVYPQDPPDTNPYPVSFRLHLACESAPAQPNDLKNHNATRGPTALVMTERGVSGVIGAQFLRDMVSRSNLPRTGGDDGHLALGRVCFWDRVGYGHSDFVYQPTSVKLQTEALYQALLENGELQHDATSARNKSAHALGQFMVVSTGYGQLFAQDFVVQHPQLVHSFLHVDAETPASWYTDKVKDTIRAGYMANYHGMWGSLWYDLLPALAEPMGVARLIGLLRGRTVVDRILAPGQRGRAVAGDLGGGGWRVKSAGGSNARLMMSTWLERRDANAGVQSRNYVRLQNATQSYHDLLAKRPVAVLSSFWKIHADVDGFADEQRNSLVLPAKDASSLVGWWRVGDRKKRSGGGDTGGPAGICSTQLGLVFCQEAVRKLIAAGQSWNTTVV